VLRLTLRSIWRVGETLHWGLHAELRLVVGRYTSDPDFPNRLRQAHWDQDDGRPILRDPLRGDTRASEAFYCYQRYRFGAFTAATMRHLDDRPRLRLHDDRCSQRTRRLSSGGATKAHRGNVAYDASKGGGAECFVYVSRLRKWRHGS
jgi:hypothetical protein